MLREKRFTEGNQWSEVIYTREHEQDPRMRVIVHTGIPHGHRRKSLRVTLVRVVTIFVTERKTYPIGSFEPIAKVDPEKDFLNKVLETMRAGYARGTEWILEKGGNRPQQASNAQAFRGGFIVLEQVEETPLDGL
jgi:hypothetical protein